MGRLSRRHFLRIGGAGAAVIASSLPWDQQATAAAGELVVNTYGGGWEAGHRAAIVTPLERKFGTKVTLVSILATEIVARTKAAQGGRPPVDAVLLDDGPLLRGIKEQLFERLPEDKIPNAAKVFPQYRLKDPYSIPIAVSVFGLAYNSKRVKTPPT